MRFDSIDGIREICEKLERGGCADDIEAMIISHSLPVLRRESLNFQAVELYFRLASSGLFSKRICDERFTETAIKSFIGASEIFTLLTRYLAHHAISEMNMHAVLAQAVRVVFNSSETATVMAAVSLLEISFSRYEKFRTAILDEFISHLIAENAGGRIFETSEISLSYPVVALLHLFESVFDSDSELMTSLTEVNRLITFFSCTAIEAVSDSSSDCQGRFVGLLTDFCSALSLPQYPSASLVVRIFLIQSDRFIKSGTLAERELCLSLHAKIAIGYVKIFSLASKIKLKDSICPESKRKPPKLKSVCAVCDLEIFDLKILTCNRCKRTNFHVRCSQVWADESTLCEECALAVTAESLAGNFSLNLETSEMKQVLQVILACSVEKTTRRIHVATWLTDEPEESEILTPLVTDFHTTKCDPRLHILYAARYGWCREKIIVPIILNFACLARTLGRPLVRKSALSALAEICEYPSVLEISVPPEEKARFHTAATVVSEALLEACRSGLMDESSAIVRQAAVSLCGSMGSSAVGPLVSRLPGESSLGVKKAICRVLISSIDRDPVNIALAILLEIPRFDDEPILANFACKSLAEYWLRRTTDFHLLSDFVQLGISMSPDALKKMLTHRDDEVLAKIGISIFDSFKTSGDFKYLTCLEFFSSVQLRAPSVSTLLSLMMSYVVEISIDKLQALPRLLVVIGRLIDWSFMPGMLKNQFLEMQSKLLFPGIAREGSTLVRASCFVFAVGVKRITLDLNLAVALLDRHLEIYTLTRAVRSAWVISSIAEILSAELRKCGLDEKLFNLLMNGIDLEISSPLIMCMGYFLAGNLNFISHPRTSQAFKVAYNSGCAKSATEAISHILENLPDDCEATIIQPLSQHIKLVMQAVQSSSLSLAAVKVIKCLSLHGLINPVQVTPLLFALALSNCQTSKSLVESFVEKNPNALLSGFNEAMDSAVKLTGGPGNLNVSSWVDISRKILKGKVAGSRERVVNGLISQFDSAGKSLDLLEISSLLILTFPFQTDGEVSHAVGECEKMTKILISNYPTSSAVAGNFFSLLFLRRAIMDKFKHGFRQDCFIRKSRVFHYSKYF